MWPSYITLKPIDLEEDHGICTGKSLQELYPGERWTAHVMKSRFDARNSVFSLHFFWSTKMLRAQGSFHDSGLKVQCFQELHWACNISLFFLMNVHALEMCRSVAIFKKIKREIYTCTGIHALEMWHSVAIWVSPGFLAWTSTSCPPPSKRLVKVRKGAPCSPCSSVGSSWRSHLTFLFVLSGCKNPIHQLQSL